MIVTLVPTLKVPFESEEASLGIRRVGPPEQTMVLSLSAVVIKRGVPAE